MNIRRFIAGLTVASVVGLGLSVAGVALSASAHDAELTASVQCQPDGSATVTYTLTNDYNLVETVIASSNPTVAPVNSTVPATGGGANTSKTFIETVAAPAANKTGSLTTHSQWSDGWPSATGQERSATYKVPSTCVVPLVAVVSVTQVAPSCSTASTYTDANFTAVNATWTDAIDNSVGTHTRHATAVNATFAGGGTTSSVNYTVSPATQNSSLDCNPPVACVVNTALPGLGDAGSNESGDLLPTQGQHGLLFKGPTAPGQAMDTYGRVLAGNAQGITNMSVTFADGSAGYPAQVVEEISRVPGGFATLSTNFDASEAHGTINLLTWGKWYTSKIASGPGSLAWVSTGNTETYAQLVANFPNNTLLSTPSLHLQTNATADSFSTVTELDSSCVNKSFVPPVPASKPGSYTDKVVCSTDNSGTGTITTHYTLTAQVWSDTEHKYVDGATTADPNKPDTTVAADLGSCPITFSGCKTQTTLPTATEVNPQGWGDLLNGTWVQGGIDLKATSTEEAYAYVDLDAAHQFKFSDIGDLTTTGTGDSAIIMQATGGQNIHREADGQFWTIHPGLFKASTFNGYAYSTYDPAADAISNPTITEVAVWVNPGHEFLLKSQNYNCQTQPFTHTAPPVVVDVPKLAETGVPILGGLTLAAILVLLGFGAVALRSRKTTTK